MPTESFVCATDSLKAIQPNNFFSAADPAIRYNLLKPFSQTLLEKDFHYYPG
jgi:hypothetical protein